MFSSFLATLVVAFFFARTQGIKKPAQGGFTLIVVFVRLTHRTSDTLQEHCCFYVRPYGLSSSLATLQSRPVREAAAESKAKINAVHILREKNRRMLGGPDPTLTKISKIPEPREIIDRLTQVN
ncbi:hypothetical protein [Methylococcus sp. EFPC2]|uniref:hypothetical protein n=1 Tax=Methylococcus sp. EFPC2 TaxID=2812648 RepID=UPI0019684AFD|nr:hypothetical protein [Methylococcus sp. EFPC2]QSA97971.1 hypothetical protein JWZ97_03845 [Methylococcus sp. EFPC2]